MDFLGNQNFNQNQLKNAVVDVGTVFPATPIVGQLFFRSDTTPKSLWIFIGVGVPGTTSGWFNLMNSYYA
jgi:hypothetical protein